MPFTFCHPAIVLPLTRSKYLSTSALIIGSTAPDFEYFLRMDMIRSHGHDFWAIFYFNLPLTLLLYLVFQYIVKVPLIINSSAILQTRFNRLINENINTFSKSNVLKVSLSACIGIFSHLLWDSFTHKQGFFEGEFPFLLETFHFLNKEWIVFQFLQIWSSILGGIYIIYFIMKMPSGPIKFKTNFLQFWSIAIIISFFVIYLRDCQTTGQFIATSISSGFIGLILSSIIFQIKLNNRQKC